MSRPSRRAEERGQNGKRKRRRRRRVVWSEGSARGGQKCMIAVADKLDQHQLDDDVLVVCVLLPAFVSSADAGLSPPN